MSLLLCSEMVCLSLRSPKISTMIIGYFQHLRNWTRIDRQLNWNWMSTSVGFRNVESENLMWLHILSREISIFIDGMFPHIFPITKKHSVIEKLLCSDSTNHLGCSINVQTPKKLFLCYQFVMKKSLGRDWKPKVKVSSYQFDEMKFQAIL